MKEFQLSGTKRTDNGKKAAKQLRAQGLIPCNIISKKLSEDGKSLMFTVKAADVRNLIYTSQVYVVNLDIEGSKCQAIIKEAQFGPVNDELLHLDFIQIDAAQPIIVKVPVKLEGHAEGVKAGGKLVKVMRDLTVKGKYADIPERLVIDVTVIKLGKVMKVKDLAFDNIEILNVKEAIVAAVRTTRNSGRAAAESAE